MLDSKNITLITTRVGDRYVVEKMKLSVQFGDVKVALYLPIWWLFVISQLVIKKWDIVHAADFDTFAPALIIAKIRRKPIVYDIFDFYADMIKFPVSPMAYLISDDEGPPPVCRRLRR